MSEVRVSMERCTFIRATYVDDVGHCMRLLASQRTSKDRVR
jgi:hypothetical protein